MTGLRLAVVAGTVAFVAGGWAGWFEGPAPDWPKVRAHELAGAVGEWVWLGAAPLIAAGVAPFTRRWLRWLWLAGLLPLAAAVYAWAFAEGSAAGFPFFFADTSDVAWGLPVSFAGSAVGLIALLSALILAVTGAPERRARRQPAAVAAVLALVVAAIVVVRGPRDEAAERRVRAALQEQCGSDATAMRVECRDRVGRAPSCAWEVELADGSTGASGDPPELAAQGLVC